MNTIVGKNLLAVVAAAVCATASAATPVAQVRGTVGDVPFPDKARSHLSHGDFVNVGNLREMRTGISKDQVRLLLGNPHFKEGLFGVKEWNYIFNFSTGEGDAYITCQYQVRYDRQEGRYLVGSMHWDGPACMELANRAPKPAVAEQSAYILSADALFRFDRAGAEDILPDGLENLNVVADQLKRADPPPQRVKVIGHTDRLGDDAYNQVLSERRAETVKNYLAGQGVKGEIVSEGRGEREPVKQCSGDTRESLIACLVSNRRVELIVEGMQ